MKYVITEKESSYFAEMKDEMTNKTVLTYRASKQDAGQLGQMVELLMTLCKNKSNTVIIERGNK